MSVDYKAIADADPGGELNSAFLSMNAETHVVSRGKYQITQLEIANQLGLDVATSFRIGVDAAVTAKALPSWVVGSLDTTGIDINHIETQRALVALAEAVAELDSLDVESVINMGNETVNVWPGLKEGYLQNAREKRAAGKI